MSLPKYKDLIEFKTIEKLDEEISIRQKELFELKMKKMTNQGIKSHMFVHLKRQIAQLNFKKSSLFTQKS